MPESRPRRGGPWRIVPGSGHPDVDHFRCTLGASLGHGKQHVMMFRFQPKRNTPEMKQECPEQHRFTPASILVWDRFGYPRVGCPSGSRVAC